MFELIIISPQVPEESIVEHVKRKKATGASGKFTLKTLEGKKPRNPLGKHAQQVGYREITQEGLLIDDYKVDLDESFGKGQWFYRYYHDEFANVYYPSKKWLRNTFGTQELDVLMEADAPTLSWNQSSFYSFPKNPPEWGLHISIDCKLLNVALKYFERPCPDCGHVYPSKRQDLCQCPKCLYVDKPFETIDEAYTILDAKPVFEGVGYCPRCDIRESFANKIEQCGYCGQILKLTGSQLNDNEFEIRRLLSIAKEQDIQSRARTVNRYNRKTWSIDLPNYWQVEETDDCIAIYEQGDRGVFAINNYLIEDGNFTLKDLIEFSGVKRPKKIKLPHLSGIFKKMVEGDKTYLTWWLYNNEHIIRVVYLCETKKKSIYKKEIESIIRSLRFIQP